MQMQGVLPNKHKPFKSNTGNQKNTGVETRHCRVSKMYVTDQTKILKVRSEKDSSRNLEKFVRPLGRIDRGKRGAVDENTRQRWHLYI